MSPNLYLCIDCGGSKTAVAIADQTGAIVARAFGGPSNFAYLGLTNFTQTVKTTVEDALRSLSSTKSTTSSATTPPDASPANANTAVTLPSRNPLFAAAWLGISGVDSPAAVARLTPVLANLLSLPPGPRLSVCNDTYLLAAPLRLHPDSRFAVAVIAGTGSIAVSFARDDEGVQSDAETVHKGAEKGEGKAEGNEEESGGGLRELARVGGWGWILGDEGGGYDVGRETLRHVLREHDRASLWGPAGPPSAPPSSTKPQTLTERVLAHFAVPSPPDLLTLVHDADPLPTPAAASTGITLAVHVTEGQAAPVSVAPHMLVAREKRISQLSPLVFAAAFDDADPLAMTVLRVTAGALAEQIAMLLMPDKAPKAEGPGTSYPPNAVPASASVLCLGGSLVGIESYRALLIDALRERGHVFQHVEFIADAAAVGAAGLVAQFQSGGTN